jgi:hypothetical protein
MSKNKKSLAETHPEVAKQWHPTKNGDLIPNNVTPGSNKKVWWKCEKGDDHEWESTPYLRTSRNSGCSICRGLKVVPSTCIATTHPEVAKQWHQTKNGELTPYDVGKGSNKNVWWKCNKGDDHQWQSKIYNRTLKNYSCPICSGRKVVLSTCLATTDPYLAKEWHPTKNGELTPLDVSRGSDKKIWWKCDKGDDHEWSGVIRDRAKSNCPVCGNKKVVLSNCLATTNPDLAKEWHPTKNGGLTPYDVVEGSHKKAWWKCDKGDDHVWNAIIKSRNNGRDCPICEGKKVVLSNCLTTINPKVAKQWHPTLNGDLTPLKITNKSGKKVWWKCDKGNDHYWKTSVANRSNGASCPYCDLTPQSKQELTITFELMKLFKNIDPKGLKTKLEGRLRAIDIFIPKLNLCIEFDGSYWHKGKRELDKIKSEILFKEGFKLIRVREEPLPSLYDTDVISKQPYNGKQVTNDILSMILSIFELDDKLVSKIKAYQSKDGLQNEKGLDKYIDKILTEKAEKK